MRFGTGRKRRLLGPVAWSENTARCVRGFRFAVNYARHIFRCWLVGYFDVRVKRDSRYGCTYA